MNILPNVSSLSGCHSPPFDSDDDPIFVVLRAHKLRTDFGHATCECVLVWNDQATPTTSRVLVTLDTHYRLGRNQLACMYWLTRDQGGRVGTVKRSLSSASMSWSFHLPILVFCNESLGEHHKVHPFQSNMT